VSVHPRLTSSRHGKRDTRRCRQPRVACTAMPTQHTLAASPRHAGMCPVQRESPSTLSSATSPCKTRREKPAR
jgi:hypothetical protein